MQVTRREAVAILDPPMTEPQVSTLIFLADIEPSGIRRHHVGHPAKLYPVAALRRAHAEEAARTAKQFTDNDWIASALLARRMIHADAEAGELWWPDGTRAEVMRHDFYGCVHAGPQVCPAHRIIWIAADGEIPPGIQVNHLNRLRWDNRRANLELVTPENNQRHRHGSPYVNYRDAVRQLAELPAAPDEIQPYARMRDGCAFL